MNSGGLSNRDNVARTPVFGKALNTARKFAEHIPLRSQFVPIILAFVCSYAAYGRISGAIVFGGFAFGGLVSFLLLFAQMRLIDDLDDLQRDYPGDRPDDVCRRTVLGRRLRIGLGVCLALIALLNHAHPASLTAAAVATAINYAAPFGAKRYTNSMALGFIVYEGAPAMIFAYIYFCWRDSLGVEPLGGSAITAVVAVFWTGYEFWKFSRKAHTDSMQPYLLSSNKIRRALSGCLVLAAASNLALSRIADLSPVFSVYSLLLPGVLLAWLNLTWAATAEAPAENASLHRPAWAGMHYVWALEAGLMLELAAILMGQ